MVKVASRLGRQVGQYLLIASMAGALASCGSSSSSDNVPLGEQDADSDGTINDEDDDADGDGIPDLNDNFVDLDGDGLDDLTLQTEAEAEGNGGNDFVEVSDENPCGSENGTDNSSVNSDWNDNCWIKRTLFGGQFADSLFTVGIQRVLYCSGYGEGADYTEFADSEYGELTEAAAKEFQRDEALTDDGIVGPQTWARLQTKIEPLELGEPGVTPDTYGVPGTRCDGIPLFYQDVDIINGNTVLGGWRLARNTPNEEQAIPFSYEKASGRL